MNPPNCHDIRERLHDLVDLELEETAKETVRGHLEGCSPCREVHEDLVALKGLVHAKIRRPLAPAGLRPAILKELSAPGRNERQRRRLAWAAAVLGAATVGGSLFLLALGSSGLAHAAMVMGCLGDFGALDTRGCEAKAWTHCKRTVLADVLSRTGLRLDAVPCLQGYIGCTPVSVHGVRGVRLDYADSRCGFAAVYVFPAARLDSPRALRVELAAGHWCQCVELEGKSVYCKESGGFVYNFVVPREREQLGDLALRMAWPQGAGTTAR